MEATPPSGIRRWAGALSLPLLFVAMIAATLADPLDDQASNAIQLRQAAAHLGQLRLTYLTEVLAAAFAIASTMAVVGAVRRRGSGPANAGAVLGVLGGIGMAMIGVGHLYLHALAASGTADAARVLAARDDAAGPVVVLFFAAPLAVVLLCVAAVRARLAPWPVLVVVAAFVVLDLVPNPLGELPALVAGLLAYGWVGLGVLGLARTAPAADRGGATAEAVPGR